MWTVKEIVRMYADGDITNWVEADTIAQAVMNNTVSAATGYLPSFLAYGWELDLDQLVDGSGRATQLDARKEALMIARNTIEEGRARMVEILSSRRNQSVRVAVYDWVMLESGGLNLPGLSDRSKKTMSRYLGPFRYIWTSKNRRSFFGVTIYYHDNDWNPHDELLAFIYLECRYMDLMLRSNALRTFLIWQRRRSSNIFKRLWYC